VSRAGLVAPLAAALLGACSAPLPEHVDVLLVTVDTLRPDHLSCYGYTRQQTPHIDQLAAEGALFEQAVSDTPWTTPSMASVLTGQYPTRHGFRSTNANRLAPENETLAEILASRGYSTAAVVGSFPLDSIFQLDQGFARYDDDFTTPIWIFPDHPAKHVASEFRDTPEERALFTLEKAMADSRRSDAEVTDAALAQLERFGDAPFFLWVHYFGPHSKPDWRLSPEERDRRHVANYDPDVRTVDAQIGRLLAGLEAGGRAAHTLVVFHADHGESLGEDGYLGHGQLLNRASMHIPLILRLPGVIPAGVRVAPLVRNIDIFPTILALSGGPGRDPPAGRSLLPLARRGLLSRWLGTGEDERVAYMETFFPAHAGFAKKLPGPDGQEVAVGFSRRSVESGRWRLERREPQPLMDVSPDKQPQLTPQLRDAVRAEELYDLEAPGGELHDVSASHPEVVARLRALLDAEVAAERAAPPGQPLDPETRLRLKSLGYVE
jgi:arylsulfatase A-like enzyme